jgi:hypothetical protein
MWLLHYGELGQDDDDDEEVAEANEAAGVTAVVPAWKWQQKLSLMMEGLLHW